VLRNIAFNQYLNLQFNKHTHTHTHATVLRPAWILSGIIRAS